MDLRVSALSHCAQGLLWRVHILPWPQVAKERSCVLLKSGGICSSPHSSISMRLQLQLTQWDRPGTRSFYSNIFDTWCVLYARCNAYLVSSSLLLKDSLSPAGRLLWPQGCAAMAYGQHRTHPEVGPATPDTPSCHLGESGTFVCRPFPTTILPSLPLDKWWLCISLFEQRWRMG